MTVSVILVPSHEYQHLEAHIVSWDDPPPAIGGRHRHTPADQFKQDISRILGVDQHDYLEIPLLRPRGDDVPGLYAYFNVPHEKGGTQNVCATRLAMACGLLSLRLYGPVLLVRSFGASRWADLSISEIRGAACVSPDLRPSIQRCLAVANTTGMVLGTDGGVEGVVPEWLANAAQQNYHDEAELQKVISAMNPAGAGGNGYQSDVGSNDCDEDETTDNTMDPEEATPPLLRAVTTTEFVTKTPLCIHCRRVSSELCESCEGVYFCSENTTTAGRNRCKNDGWSHACMCPTWRLYSGPNRRKLSRFDDGFFGEWQDALTSRPHQLGEEPYEEFLRSFFLGIEAESSSSSCASWWRTEFGGWSGGKSYSASKVDATIRQSYSQGFAPIVDLPPERRITQDDIERSGMQSKRNAVGLLALSSWKEYYTVRNISPTSPVCLLCTFPLTIYRAIEQYGDVPVTVARMLHRPLRIHVVGAEKEMNFLDLFKELTFLLPEDMKLELVFVVREDMMPPKCQTTTRRGDKFSMKIDFEAMVIGVVSGTYGTATLDPNFDVGTGPPDMVVAMNAGLYAYESWRSVVNYLYYNRGVVGVFSDYNEYSGVNCAALGGWKSRQSLCMNPFRQPRAMPVYSMNLPQFSNGYLYVFNEQELE